MKKLLTTLIILTTVAGLGSQLSAEMSAEQLAKKKAYFTKWDTNKDGAQSKAEFLAMTKAQFVKKKKTGWEVEGEKRFKRNDLNKDGKVTFEESMAKK